MLYSEACFRIHIYYSFNLLEQITLLSLCVNPSDTDQKRSCTLRPDMLSCAQVDVEMVAPEGIMGEGGVGV